MDRSPRFTDPDPDLRNFVRKKDGSFSVVVGSCVIHTVHEAIVIATKDKRSIEFEFGNVHICVHGDSCMELILRDWDRAYNGLIPKRIGPYPNPVLSDAQREAYLKVKNSTIP